MAESVVKLRVDSKEYETKIKRAADGVRAFGENCQKAGQSIDKADKQTLDYVRAIGQMETVSRTAKGKVNEMTSAFTDLSVQYRNLTEQERQTPFGKALAQSLDQLKIRIKETKAELSAINSELGNKMDVPLPTEGGLLGGSKLNGMLQVFGGNMMTKAVGWAANLANSLGDAVQQGIELAKAGEGIRIAFDRLNRPDLLDKLREATHGTVTDLELMKQAVKFNDFNLSLDEMGTMLAFAQQKAKDTGQSVDYMVDSIVTGLGRKSLMILDNLGLSAAEIKDKMGETGDMTKAVGEIIREQMSKAGDYIETTADRAARADAELKNAMEELGRTFQPLADAGTAVFHSLEVGALNLLNRAIKPLIDNFTALGRARKAYESQGGSTEVQNQISALRGSNYKNFAYNATVNAYNKQIGALQKQIDDANKSLKTNVGGVSASKGIRDSLNDLIAQRDATKRKLDEYIAGAKEILNPSAPVIASPAVASDTAATVKTGKTGRTGTVHTTQAPPPAGSIAEQEAKVQALTKAWREATDEVGRAGYAGMLEEAKKVLDQMQGKATDIVPEGSLKDLNNQIQELQKQRELLTDPIEVAIIDTDIERVKDQIDELNGKLKTIAQPEPITLEEKIRTTLSEEKVTADMQALTSLVRVKLENGLDNLEIPSEYIQQAIFGEGIDIPDSYWQDLADEINTKLKELGIEPITIDVKTGNVTQTAKEVKAGWQSAAHAVQSVGSALQQIEDPSAKIVGIVGQAIANIALGFAQATAKTGAGGGIFGWIAAIAGGLGTMISTISAIHSATGYSEGGMIKGHSFSGDNIMANGGTIGLNAGEIVLNRAQQGNLVSQFNDTSAYGDRQPYLDVETIWLGMKHFLNRNGMGEIVTTKR